jgi:hypothetical protein
VPLGLLVLLQLVTAGLLVLLSGTAGGVGTLFDALAPGIGCSLAEFVETVVSFPDCRSQPARKKIAAKAAIAEDRVTIFIGVI